MLLTCVCFLNELKVFQAMAAAWAYSNPQKPPTLCEVFHVEVWNTEFLERYLPRR
jgi:hypothetical protein